MQVDIIHISQNHLVYCNAMACNLTQCKVMQCMHASYTYRHLCPADRGSEGSTSKGTRARIVAEETRKSGLRRKGMCETAGEGPINMCGFTGKPRPSSGGFLKWGYP